MTKPVELFHIGPPKTGTTWIHRMLIEHPAIASSCSSSIHFFDMLYARGVEWYDRQFPPVEPGRILFDPTQSYLHSTWASRRIAAYNPAAKIAVCMRNPIERAFSHYWHERKKRRFNYEFGEVLENYDLFASWLEPGFYAEHLERYFNHFPREQILVQRFEDLETDPGRFLRELLAFAGVDPEFVPSTLNKRINAAGPRHDTVNMGLYAVQKTLSSIGLQGIATKLEQSKRLSGKGEYLRGIPTEVAAELLEVCEPEIARLEKLLGVGLAEWRRPPAGANGQR